MTKHKQVVGLCQNVSRENQHVWVAVSNTKGEDMAAAWSCLPQRKTRALTLDPEPPEGGRGHSTRIKLGHQRRSPQKWHHGRILSITAHWWCTTLRLWRNMQTKVSWRPKRREASHQTTLRSSIKRQPALKRSALMYVLVSLLPFSKNSDRRFKFFRDMDSDSTWETENRFQRATLKSNKNDKHIFQKETVFLIW